MTRALYEVKGQDGKRTYTVQQLVDIVPALQLPDLYIRHSNYPLRLDPISDAQAGRRQVPRGCAACGRQARAVVKAAAPSRSSQVAKSIRPGCSLRSASMSACQPPPWLAKS